MKELTVDNGQPRDVETVIVCTACGYRRPTTEQHPTIAGDCPECGGPLTYED